MAPRVELRGTADFKRTAAKLKAAGDGRLTREMRKKMKSAAQPAVNDAQQSVRGLDSQGSSRGGGGQARREFALSRVRNKSERAKRKAFEGRGLRASIARAVQTQVRSSSRTASVRIRVNASQLPKNQRQLPRYMNAGSWRHPVFGNRNNWATQTVTPAGWWDRPMRRHGPKVRKSAVGVVDDISRQITS